MKNKPVWRKTGNRQNHYLDCEVLCSVAANILNVLALPQKVKKKSETPIAVNKPAGGNMERRGL